MCDCPTAGVFTTHETHRSWIIFQECKTEHGNDVFFYEKIFLFLKLKNGLHNVAAKSFT